MNLRINGMHCAGCVHTIEQGVSHLPGVLECTINLAMKSAVVRFDPRQTNEKSILGKIKELGYDAAVGMPDILSANEKEEAAARRRFLLSVVLALPLMVVTMGEMVAGVELFPPPWSGIIQAVLAGMILFGTGGNILADAAHQARRFHANMNTLIAMGSLAAFGWSVYALGITIFTDRPEPLYFDSAGMIVTLILFGRFLEARARGKAGEAIRALFRLRPKTTTALIEGTEVEIDVDSVQPGMVLRVKPGERIPADGIVTEGRPFVDESMLTGEAMPVEKKEGEKVIGGSLNGNVPFTFRVTASGDETVLATIIRMVTEAQSKKAPVQNLADRVAAVFVPIVMGLAALTLVGWLLFDADNPVMVKSVISVLIIACPCALGLATPTAVLAGTGRAAKEGIIIRGGDIVECLTKVDAVIFDKTGTLTYGKLTVVDVKTFGRLKEPELIGVVASIERHSEHPLAQAVVEYQESHLIKTVPVKNIAAKPGFGMEAEWDGRRVLIGNKALIEQEGIAFGNALALAEEEMSMGRTVVYVAVELELVGLIAIADKLRSDAKEVVTALKRRMKKVTMLSGDTRQTARGVAHSVGLDDFEAGILPDQKQIIVDSYRKAGFCVAMVGDGINDAPALAVADVGIAVGSGTDVAMETADVILVRRELSALLRLFDVSSATLKVIKQNLFWAFFYNVVAIPIAAGVFYPVWGWTLSPIIAAGAMAFSSLFVVSNSLRLTRLPLGFREEE